MALPAEALVENHASPATVGAPAPTAPSARTPVDMTYLLAEVRA